MKAVWGLFLYSVLRPQELLKWPGMQDTGPIGLQPKAL
jgi:hypothetical protein